MIYRRKLIILPGIGKKPFLRLNFLWFKKYIIHILCFNIASFSLMKEHSSLKFVVV